jgi:hypothetical protein
VLFGSGITIVLWLMVAASILLPVLTRRKPLEAIAPAAKRSEDEQDQDASGS